MLIDHLARHWWLLVIRGVLAIVFGLFAVFWPGVTLLVLAIFFGAYALADGLFAAVGAVRAPRGGRSPFVLEAIAGIVFGIVTLIWPHVTILAITILVGLWAIISGVGEIVTAVQMRKEIRGEAMYVLFGVISVVFGLLVLFWPVSGALAVAWLIGFAAIAYGIAVLVLGLRLHTIAPGASASSVRGYPR